jgi:predicted DNA-binding protein
MSDEANQMSQTPYSIRFRKPMRERLDRLVAVTKRPMSFFVTEALEQGRSIETLEAIYLDEAMREQTRARELEGDMNRGLRQMSLAV